MRTEGGGGRGEGAGWVSTCLVGRRSMALASLQDRRTFFIPKVLSTATWTDSEVGEGHQCASRRAWMTNGNDRAAGALSSTTVGGAFRPGRRAEVSTDLAALGRILLLGLRRHGDWVLEMDEGGMPGGRRSWSSRGEQRRRGVRRRGTPPRARESELQLRVAPARGWAQGGMTNRTRGHMVDVRGGLAGRSADCAKTFHGFE